VVGVAQLVEHRVVAPVVVGSSPITHPISSFQRPLPNRCSGNGLQPCAPVAQLDRAPDFESVGRRFESCRAYQKIKQMVKQSPSAFFVSFGRIRAKSAG
jgi:hypothetical protein